MQTYVKNTIVNELKNKLNTDLGIASLSIQPFNGVQLKGVYLKDRKDSTILTANTVYADFELLPLLDNQLVITSAKLVDFEVDLSKDSTKAPLNIQFVIDAFQSKDTLNKTKLDVKVNSINLADGRFRFDVKDRPFINDKFDPNHIYVSDLNAKLAIKSVNPDSLNIQIKKLQLQERSGLQIKNLIVRVLTQGKHLSIKGFRLTLPKSLLQFDRCEFDYSRFLTPADFLDNVVFDTKISSSYIALRDIKAFVPAFENFQDRILFKTDIRGKLDSISVDNITLDYGDEMHLKARGFVGNARRQEQTYIDAKVEALSISENGIVELLNNFSKEKKETPPILLSLGALSFEGKLNGYLKKMKAEGSLTSTKGIVHADAILGLGAEVEQSFFFEGHVNTRSFKLGELLKKNNIGDISFDLKTRVVKPKKGKLQGAVDGIIQEIAFNKYTYKNVVLSGDYDGLRLDGNLEVDDPNGILNINGLFDLSEDVPKLDFYARLKNARLDNLNLTEKYKESYFGFIVNANFKGKNIDDIEGYIKADSISFQQSGQSFRMNNLKIEALGQADARTLTVESDLLDGKVIGAYSFTDIVESFKKTINAYLPALVDYKENKKKKYKTNNLEFNFTIKNTEKFSQVFKLPVTVHTPAKIVGFYNDESDRFKLEAFVPSLKAGGSKIQAGYLVVENSEEQIKAAISTAFVTKKGTSNDFSTHIGIRDNKIDMASTLYNKDNTQLKGELFNSVEFSKLKGNQLEIAVNFMPGELVLNNIVWIINESKIRIKGSRIDIDNFGLVSKAGDQELRIDGIYSPKEEGEKLDVQLKKIDLDYVFKTLAIEALQFGGRATGDLQVSSIKGKPYAGINLNVDDFAFNNTTLGNLELYSNLDNESLKVNLEGKITNQDSKITGITGFINPLTQELSINFDAEEITIAFLNKYVATLFNGVNGKGKGQVRLFGSFSEVTVEGEAFIEKGTVGINFLNTNYTFTDTIFLKKDLIYFKDVAFKDDKGNIAKINGRVVHDYFTNFMYYVDLSASNFLLYNAPEKLNPMFYGTVFGSGSGVIKGDERVVDINMNLHTNKNTHVYMNFMEETAAEYSFLSYKSKDGELDSLANGADRYKLKRIKTDSGIEMNLNFYVDATPDATVEFLMDPIGGDKLRGSGSGALQFVWGTSKDPMLYGTYQINKGSYNFTFQKIMERKFLIQDGSSVQFRGDPFQANINIDAIYKVVANLNDLDRNLALSTGQNSVPVNCLLNITGLLRRPNIKLDIALPAADPEIQRQVKSLMNTEDMINRQIVYLLLLSKFYTPSYAVTDQKTSDFAAVASATLSAQLSRILSQIDDRWQIGTNIRTSNSEFANTEVELLLSSRLLNDRLLFNGNFGYRDNVHTTDAFIGDIDIEVLLNRIGTWRLKAYNHYNEKYYYVGGDKSSVQTQGLGIVYKRDFDSVKELFIRPKKTLKPSDKDTTTKADTLATTAQFVKMK
ncbi:MAG: hypothetical protein RL662_1079 [Bacteroidota bacterium]